MTISDDKLAIDGAAPTVTGGPPSWPPPDEAVRTALIAAYEDGSWGRYLGPNCQRLIRMLSEFHSLDHVLLCSSGTIAVELALRGLGVAAGDEVILAGYDFPGNFRAVEAVGAAPVLVDIEPETWCLDPDHFDQAITESTRAIIVSHLHGGVARMREIMSLAASRGLLVVEDACQAPGARIAGHGLDGQLAGTWGDVSVLSFGGSKLLTAGRGGAIFTRHANVFQRAKIFAQRGNDAFPLSELQAAVLCPQLSRLGERNALRNQMANHLTEHLRSVTGLLGVRNPTDTIPSFYKMAWRYDAEHWGGVDRATFLAALQAEGVAIDEGFRGFTRRSAGRCRRVGSLEHSDRAAQQTVLLHHPVLLEPTHVIDQVAQAFVKVQRWFSV